jgi:hypothetical protein
MNQLAMDFRPAPYQRHSATSKAAAKALKPSKVEQDRALILSALKIISEGMTDDLIQSVTCLPGDSERPRRISLLKDGLICDSGRKALTRSGKLAVVWVAREHFNA